MTIRPASIVGRTDRLQFYGTLTIMARVSSQTSFIAHSRVGFYSLFTSYAMYNDVHWQQFDFLLMQSGSSPHHKWHHVRRQKGRLYCGKARFIFPLDGTAWFAIAAFLQQILFEQLSKWRVDAPNKYIYLHWKVNYQCIWQYLLPINAPLLKLEPHAPNLRWYGFIVLAAVLEPKRKGKGVYMKTLCNKHSTSSRNLTMTASDYDNIRQLFIADSVITSNDKQQVCMALSLKKF